MTLKASAVLALVGPVLLLGSCARGLDSRAAVRISIQAPDNALQAAAAALRGMTLVQDPSPDFWTSILRKDRESAEPHDLFAAEWGREIVSARADGSLADLSRLWPRAAASRRMPAFSPSVRPTPSQGFIPAAVSTWGLFYNRRLYAALGSPAVEDMDALTALLEAAKGRGHVPIALGAAFGWPGAAWFTFLDIRLNGGQAAWERIEGTRPFDDPAGAEAAARLSAWRDAGFFSPGAPGTAMEDSLRDVQAGRALLVLMSAQTAERFVDSAAVGFMSVPSWPGRGEPRGEMASITGFVVPAASHHQQAALALVDAYLAAGSTAQAGTAWLPIAPAPGKAGVHDEVRDAERAALAAALWVVPSMDRSMDPAFVQGSLQVWSGFFARRSGMDGAALVSALQRLRSGAAVDGGGTR